MKKLITIIIIIAICMCLTNYFNIKERIYKFIYPTNYSEYVEKYAEENTVDKLLIYSIIKVESNFKRAAKSQSGAMGLMQIMKTTATETANELGYDEISEEDLYKPELNIQIGVKYFTKLLKIYDDNMNLAIMAYNAGIGNVNKWIKNGIIKEDGSDIENIPYTETRNYVKKILRDYETYKKLYIGGI